MAGTFTFNNATRTITVTGGTLAAPADMYFMYAADKAGTLELLAASAAAMNLSLTTAIRPTDKVALKINLVITGFVGAGNVTLTGTNKDGGAQSEVIAVAGNGTLGTTLWYASIDAAGVDCTGTYTIQITQSQWGVVWKLGFDTYKLDTNFVMGDGSTATWFTSLRETMIFDCAYRTKTYGFTVKANATFRLGAFDSTAPPITPGTGEKGSNLIWDSPKNSVYCDNYGTLEIYNSRVMEYNSQTTTGSVVWTQKAGATFTSVDNIYYGLEFCFFNDGAATISSTRDQINGGYASFTVQASPTSVLTQDTVMMNAFIGLMFYNLGAETVTLQTLKLLTGQGSGEDIQVSGSFGTTIILENCELASWVIGWEDAAAGTRIYRRYTMVGYPVDEDGNTINSVDVLITDVFGTVIVNTNTDIDSYFFVDLNLGYYDAAHASVLQTYAPFTLTLSKAGYQTYTTKFTPSEPIIWQIALQDAIVLTGDANPTDVLSGKTFYKDDYTTLLTGTLTQASGGQFGTAETGRKPKRDKKILKLFKEYVEAET